VSPIALAVTLAFGLLVGVLSGLVGIGGGAVMVPFLYVMFAAPAFSGVVLDPRHEVIVAHATSLFVIVPTALSGLRTYQKSGLIDWSVVLPMAGATTVAAMGGAILAERLPGSALKAGFGLSLVLMGARLLRPRPVRTEGAGEPKERLGALASVLCGCAVGLFSALLGVGGGLLAIPLLIYVVGLDLPRVAATSIGLVVFAAVSGTLSYIAAGWGTPGLPPWTLGYVFAPVALALIPGAVIGARWGALLNQRLDAGLLKVIFGVLFMVEGLELLVQTAPDLF
jgi:uncharacterized membrane protein YfcA